MPVSFGTAQTPQNSAISVLSLDRGISMKSHEHGAGALAPDDVQAAGKKTPGGKLDEPERRN
ncbi:MAG: hypothetical protein KUG70_11570 [Rhodobacteraceae bacterium]|nr:hypothetical protein [Paracoccaceae bacterium]